MYNSICDKETERCDIMERIYIIGPLGSGKTTFSKKLSEKYHIKRYELDKVLWDDDNGNIKRADDEVQKLFNDILKKKTWIIEDVGRAMFKEGRKKADIIFYINLSRFKSYFRIIKRWVKQKLGIEVYNSPPTFKELVSLISMGSSYYKKEKIKLKELEKYNDKLIFINNKKMKGILKDKYLYSGKINKQGKKEK